MLMTHILVGGISKARKGISLLQSTLILMIVVGTIQSQARPMAHSEDQVSSCQMLLCGTYQPMALEISQGRNLSTRNDILQPVHNFTMTHLLLDELVNSWEVVIPASVKIELKDGVQLWDLALAYHYKNNLHHNYSTTDNKVAQEIALDFFSSALVSCMLTGEEISKGKVKTASRIIKTWPNHIKSSKEVKDAIELVTKALFDHFEITPDTDEEAIPSKPYNCDVARRRYASEKLLETYKAIVGCNVLARENILEYELLLKLVHYFNDCLEGDIASHMWVYGLSDLFAFTELGKSVSEVYYHKLLVVDFHEIIKKMQVDGYVVTNEIAENHDNDKYIPFQVIAYTLKWYYNDLGLFIAKEL